MKSLAIILSTAITLLLLSNCGSLLNVMTENVTLHDSLSQPVDHDDWTVLLKKHVRDGKLDYSGMIADSTAFNKYLHSLKSALPNDKNWSREQQFAYWINAYNAFTVKLIMDNYPVNSIKDIKGGLAFVNSVWDIKFIEIEGQTFDLNNIEHGILRDQFKDPRIHFAINCASISCPALLDEAFTADKIEEQLDLATTVFFFDRTKNKFSTSEAKISKIFKWFKKDFTDQQSLREFLGKHAPFPITDQTKISHLDYDWNLNDVRD